MTIINCYAWTNTNWMIVSIVIMHDTEFSYTRSILAYSFKSLSNVGPWWNTIHAYKKNKRLFNILYDTFSSVNISYKQIYCFKSVNKYFNFAYLCHFIVRVKVKFMWVRLWRGSPRSRHVLRHIMNGYRGTNI